MSTRPFDHLQHQHSASSSTSNSLLSAIHLPTPSQRYNHAPRSYKREWTLVMILSGLVGIYFILVAFFVKSPRSPPTSISLAKKKGSFFGLWPFYHTHQVDTAEKIAPLPPTPVSSTDLVLFRNLWKETISSPWQHWPAIGFCRDNSSLIEFMPHAACGRAQCLYSESLKIFVDLDKFKAFSRQNSDEKEEAEEGESSSHRDWSAIEWKGSASFCRHPSGGQLPPAPHTGREPINAVETSFVVSLERDSLGVRYDGVDALLEVFRVASETTSAEYFVEIDTISDSSSASLSAPPPALIRFVKDMEIVFKISVSLSPTLSLGERAISFDADFAQKCRGSFIATVRADVLVLPGWLSLSLYTFKQSDKDVVRVGAVGPLLLTVHGRVLAAEGIVSLEREMRFIGTGMNPHDFSLQHARGVDFLSLSCVVLRKEALPRHRPMRWSFLQTNEQSELSKHQSTAFQRAQEMIKLKFRSVFQPLSVVVQLDESLYQSETRRVRAAEPSRLRKIVDSHVLHGHCPSSLLPPSSTSLTHDMRFKQQLERDQAMAFFRDPSRVLVLEDIVPETDRDAGSIRLYALLQILTELGFAVSFEPQPITGRSIRYVLPLLAQGVNMLLPGTLHDMATASQNAISEKVRSRGQICPWKLLFIARRDVYQRHLEDVQKLCPGIPVIFDTVDVHFIRELRMFSTKYTDESSDTSNVKTSDSSSNTLDVVSLLESVQSAQEAMRKLLDAQQRELDYMKRSKITLVVSTTEQQIIQKLFDNKVDVRVVSNIYTVEDTNVVSDFQQRQGAIFTGNMCHTPNVDAVEFIIRNVLNTPNALPADFKMHFVWSRSQVCVHPIYLEALAHPMVVVHRDVSNEELYELHSKVKLVLAPLRYGAGVKGKVNYGLLHGVPVIATRVASEGMGLTTDKNFLLAETGQEFIEAIQRLYKDEALFEKLVKGGKEVMKSMFGRNVAKDKIRQALIDVESLPIIAKREENRECPLYNLFESGRVENWKQYWFNDALQSTFFPIYPRVNYHNQGFLCV